MTRNAPLLATSTSLARRELVRFIRQPNRVIGALATPIVFWLVIGSGMGRSFAIDQTGGSAYLTYFFPGALLLMLLFTAIFSMISIIEDRREGFLQSVLVAPVSRQAIVLGKVLGGTALAIGQGILFLLLAPLAGIYPGIIEIMLTLAVMVLTAFTLTAIGFCIAWPLNSTQGFHAIMNLLLMPMWFLSGALFPASGASAPVAWLMYINPLYHALSALRRAIYFNDASLALPSMGLSLTICGLFAAVLFALASRLADRRTAGDMV